MLTGSIRAGGAAAGLLSLLAMAGCGGGSGNTSSPSGGTPAVDACIVNTWMSSTEAAQIQGQQAQVTGGTGEKVTIGSDGSIDIDDSNVAPLQITVGGQSLQVKQTGQATGRATTSGNKLHVDLTSSNLSSQAFDATGAPQGTPDSVPKSVNDTYTCSANQQLRLTQSQNGGSETVTFVPASSGGGSGSSTDTGSSSSSSDTGGGSSTDTGSSSSST